MKVSSDGNQLDFIMDPLFKLNERLSNIISLLALTNEPHHKKTCFCHMRTTKAQISLADLRIRAVWSAPLLFAA